MNTEQTPKGAAALIKAQPSVQAAAMPAQGEFAPHWPLAYGAIVGMILALLFVFHLVQTHPG